MQHDLGQLHPQEDSPGRDLSAENLVSIIPSALIGLDHAAVGAFPIERCPAVRRDVHRIDLIGSAAFNARVISTMAGCADVEPE